MCSVIILVNIFGVLSMSLIICSECGNKISDKAAACPHCGNPILSLPKCGTIHFFWADKKGNSIRKTKIILDDVEEIGIIECNDCISAKVSFGRHKVCLYQGKHCLIKEYFDINDNNHEEFYAFKERMGFTHAQLKRVFIDFSDRIIRKKNVPKCPTCGSEKISKISLTRRAIGFEVMGFASSSAGKTFICKSCGYKW